MWVLSRRAALVIIFTLAGHSAHALFGFGGDEPQRRKAFIDFLQTQIVDKPGVHIFKLTDADNKAFGDYTKHYGVLADFASDPTISMMYKNLNESLPVLHSLQSVIDQRVAIRKIAADFGEALRATGEKYDTAKVAKDALTQPDDLKAVYDKAFDKLVTAPVMAFRESIPIAQDIAVAMANLGDYVAAHSSSVGVVGNSLKAKDSKTQADIDRLLNALNVNVPRFNDAQRRLQIVLQGS